ncbi:MAG: bifunctional DNA-formamidopyrimidine glycosylase/DNA-(apurinic or apyrimidinic site) lyase [Candidatus Nanopelagicales bacterium]
MPELPEVETVRVGLQRRVVGRHLGGVQVAHERAVRRQAGGVDEFLGRMSHVSPIAAQRRGKYLWLELADSDDVLVAHLGMSGQFRVVDNSDLVEPDPHRRVWWPMDDGSALVFRDQRTFGWVLADERAGDVPTAAAHIARDPFDPLFDAGEVSRHIRRSRSGIKRVLLAQTFVSGVGNIYADEALWRCQLHPEHPANRLSSSRVAELLEVVTDIMRAAIAAGGTSFDPLYVAVNGDSGWFDRSLSVYGRESEPCARCGRPIVREQFANRSSHRCPKCQRRPRVSTAGIHR